MQTMTDYDKQAQEFLTKTGATFDAKFLFHGKHFDDDKDMRDVYLITIKRDSRLWRFNFGQSIAESGDAHGSFVNECPRSCVHYNTGTFPCRAHARKRTTPSAYSVLAAITKYDPGTFQNFCDEFGYDTDSRRAEKVYFAVQNEWDNVRKMWRGKEIELLGAIQ